MIILLIEKWADVNARDITCNTPLHIAAYLNQFKAVQLLLFYLSIPLVKNTFCLMPIDLTREKLIKFIIQRASLVISTIINCYM